MAVALGVAAAVFAGAGDFFGGLASRRGRVVAVSTWAHVAGIGATIVLAPLIENDATAADLAWGATAGVAGGTGILMLYRGFIAGDMSVVSPIAAVGAAGWPILFALVAGDRPGPVQWFGVVVGLVAIWTVSRDASTPGGSGRVLSGVPFAIAAGAGFGGLLIFLSFVGDSAGIWPLLPARITGTITVAAVGITTAAPLMPLRGTGPPVLAAGALTVIGNGAFILAANQGSLAVVSILTAMFPAATVLLARVVLSERLGPRRRVGLALSLLAVGLIAAG